MELINSTRMVTDYTLGVDPSGRESLVVVIKGTFRIPELNDATLVLHEDQVPLVMSDIYFGEPGLSAPRYESDFVPRKPRCDILLNGTAYAPGGKPVERLVVEVQLGSWSKLFAVVGDRTWRSKVLGPRSTTPKPFTTMPIDYGHAFGGIDRRHDDPARHVAYMPNPAGRGFHRHLAHGQRLPNTEEIGRTVKDPNGVYFPMAFGPIGRNWEPRRRYAGTYDQEWLDRAFPYLPKDFDEQYFQAAPPDQQISKPRGDYKVTLLNLTPAGHCNFVLPHFDAPIHIFPRKGKREDLTGLLDAVLIEPDLRRVILTWRASRLLKRDLFEIEQILVGRKGNQWWQQRMSLVEIPVSIESLRRERQPRNDR